MKLQLEILAHQTKALKVINKVFDEVEINYKNDIYQNPEINFNDETLFKNIQEIQKGIYDETIKITNRKFVKDEPFGIDIKMETGTGKTYCYSRMMYELHKNYGFNKFIILVPSTPIKEGTKNFIESNYAKQHFLDLYPSINFNLQILNAQKQVKNKRKMFPQAISNFIKNSRLEKNKISCLLMTDKMLLSKSTMDSEYDQVLFGKISNPYKIIREIKPIVIIDEPHRFKRENKAYKCIIDKLNPQAIIRFGATFDKNEKTGEIDYNNLIYNLNSIAAFNEGLVKGVTVETLDNISDNDTKVKLLKITSSKPIKAILKNEKTDKIFELGIGDNLSEISEEFFGISIQDIGKYGTNNSQAGILLSNEQVLLVGDSLFSSIYSSSYQELMLKQALRNHFSQEKANFFRKRKIKTLSLFFIDSVSSYRGEKNDGYLKLLFEDLLKKELEYQMQVLQKEMTSSSLKEEYLDFLNYSLKNIKDTNGGYFSKDNSTKDEDIQNEIDIILKDKETLLSFKNQAGTWNVMRFIFSKWTLREGWDNPNVFQIIKLRSSGSENSKLQEVGRGLRLPVDEYGNRISNEDFYLNYLIDFSEKDFANKLITEVNSEKDQIKNIEALLEKVAFLRRISSKKLLIELLEKDYIDINKNIIEEKSLEFFEEYPEFKQGLKEGKIIKKDKENRNYVHIRKENFNKLKDIWEAINKKYYLKLEELSEIEILEGINKILNEIIYNSKTVRTTREKIVRSEADNDSLSLRKEEGDIHLLQEKILYNEFLKKLNKITGFSLPLLHKGFINLNKIKKIPEDFFNTNTLNSFISQYQVWLETVYINKFSYEKLDIKNSETALTDISGNIKDKILQNNLGLYKNENFQVPNKFLYDKVVYDSPLEMENIEKSNIKEIVVFGKIPRRSIKLPLYFGGTTSPDFIYVLKREDGSLEMNLIVETKDVKNMNELRKTESFRIESAKKFFETIEKEGINVKFKKQLKKEEMVNIIKSLIH